MCAKFLRAEEIGKAPLKLAWATSGLGFFSTKMAIASTLGRSAVTWIWTWALFSAWAGALSLIEAEGLVADEPKSALMASSSFLAVKASLGHSAASARGGLNRPVPPAATSTAVARVFLRKV